MLIFGAFFATARTASAQATWTGAINGAWNNTGNWSGTAPGDGSSLALIFGAPGAGFTGAGNVNLLSNVTATSMTFNGNNNYVLNGQFINLGGTVSNTGGTNNIGMDVVLTATRTFDVTGGDLTVSGILLGAGGLTKTGGNTLTLTRNNTYTGVTTINGGELSIASVSNATVAGPLGNTTAAAANLVIDGGTLTYTGGTGSTNRGFTAGASSATINVTTAATNLTISGNSVMTGALNKTGPGILTLSGANTGAGTTNVNAGTLALNNTSGAATGTGLTTVASGATIQGTGTIGGDSSIQSGGTLSPGNSIGTLNSNAGISTWVGGGRLLVEFDHTSGAPLNAGTTIDRYNSAGSLNLSATTGTPFIIDLDLIGNPSLALQTPQSVPIATFAAGGFGTFTDPAQFTFVGDFVGTPTITVDIPSNSLVLNFTPVPEPATVGIFAVAIAGFAARRMRKRAA